MTHVIRAATTKDVEAMYEMAKLTGGGFTNLPPDRDTLAAKLERSAKCFAKNVDRPDDDLFVLVLEDLESGEVRGTCQLFTEVGQQWPFYSYRIQTHSQHSQELERTFRAEMLSLVTDLEGSSEVGGLFLHPNSRAGGLGMLLARSRYLFIAMHRDRFGERILAELRGIIDDKGGSPFWDGLAGKFFGMSFQEADEFNALNGNQFIADLMPKSPIYTAMLPESARAVIGLPHPNGRAAMRMLEKEGFAYEGYVDIFDGGPTVTSRTNALKTIRESQPAEISRCDLDIGDRVLIATGANENFRCCYGMIEAEGDTIAIDHNTCRALQVEPGDTAWTVGR
ncbi:arginine N-succinyltransferase [Pseudoblastomonas halimionae]|uniref:Arginine N-succinyltransferase n=1 Tax=Alteriqipengyuania halimionae TaxID=1926630 RepID=A0A6I4TZ81_9SPHN|nr:arginine N-succinyltransferase [Alteriqipengyuania halimionae]MXP09010.1 arginine N-succinyltransferase [Alteriqipengyuania halimionae]